jgi:hypothetical protein
MPFVEQGKNRRVQEELSRLRELAAQRRLASMRLLLARREIRRAPDSAGPMEDPPINRRMPVGGGLSHAETDIYPGAGYRHRSRDHRRH